MATLSRAANRVGLVWNPPPCPEPSRLDDWFLGVAWAGSQPPTPVPFFPEVHEELAGTWKAPFTARNRASGPSSLTTLDGGAAKGYTRIPPVERAVAMQLCPNSTWRGEPSLPSRACKKGEGDCPRSPRRSNNLHPSGAVEPVVSGVSSPSRPPPRGAAKPRARGPRTGDPEMIRDCSSGDSDCTAPSPGGGPGGKSFVFSFCYLAPRDGHERCIACLGLAHAEAAFVDESCTHCGKMIFCTQIFNKRAVSVISGSEEGSESSGRSKTSPLSSTSSVASGQQRAVRDGHPSLSCTPCPGRGTR